MAYWDGARWVPESAVKPPVRETRRGRLLGAATEASLIVLLAFGLIAGTTFAAKGGNGGGGNGHRQSSGTCVVEGTVVHGTGLPLWELMNFMVTTDDGTSGWVIGFTDTGERWISVTERSGPTRYEFAGRTYGSDGSKYEVFATCEG